MSRSWKCPKCGLVLTDTDPKAHAEFCNPATGPLKETFHRLLGRDRGAMGRRVAGSIEMAFLRGQQTGRHDAYLKVRRKHPKAAAALLKAFSMNAKGEIRV